MVLHVVILVTNAFPLVNYDGHFISDFLLCSLHLNGFPMNDDFLSFLEFHDVLLYLDDALLLLCVDDVLINDVDSLLLLLLLLSLSALLHFQLTILHHFHYYN